MPQYRVEYRTTSASTFKRFKRYNFRVNVDSKTWMTVIKTFNELFSEYLLQTGVREKLPYGLGGVAISKKKTIKIFNDPKTGYKKISLPIDWPKTKEYGRPIYIMNSHSDGYRCKFKWFRDDTNLRMAQIWVCKPLRHVSRQITNYLKDEDGLHYLEKWGQWETRVGKTKFKN